MLQRYISPLRIGLVLNKVASVVYFSWFYLLQKSGNFDFKVDKHRSDLLEEALPSAQALRGKGRVVITVVICGLILYYSGGYLIIKKTL